MSTALLAVAVVVALLSPAASASDCPKVTPMAGLNLTEYVRATWYIQQQQINGYQTAEELFCVSATYALQGKKVPFFNGTVASVYNYGDEKRVNGKPENPNNRTILCARIVNESAPSKLIVAPCFLPNLFAGDYWVMAAGPSSSNYEWAIVSGGQPTVKHADGCSTKTKGINGSGFWLFTRATVASSATITEMRDTASKLGFSLSQLLDVKQAGCKREGEFIKPNEQ
jgi:lipocalin